jgi:hypothetical protein
LASAPDDAWSLVFLFYSALHFVDGYLKTKAPHFFIANHGARSSAIRGAPELNAAASAYRALQALSEQVRYDPVFRPSIANFEAAKRYFEKVRSVVEPKLLRAIVAAP